MVEENNSLNSQNSSAKEEYAIDIFPELWGGITLHTQDASVFLISVAFVIIAVYLLLRKKNSSKNPETNTQSSHEDPQDNKHDIKHNIPNHHGLSEDEMKKLNYFYANKEAPIDHFHEIVENYATLQKNLASLSGNNEQVKNFIDEAWENVKQLEFNPARDKIECAQMIEQQDIEHARDNFLHIVYQKAEKFTFKADVAVLHFDYHTARDDYIEAYLFLQNNIPSSQLTDNSRKILIGYLNNVVTYSLKAGLYQDEKTIEYVHLAKDFGEKHLENEHPNSLTAINNLGLLYESQQRYDDAESLYQNVLEARTRLLGRKHRDTLKSLNNLAILYRKTKRYDEAEPLFKEVLEANIEILGHDDVYTLKSLNNLAGLYDSKGYYDEAESLYQNVLEARTRLLGRHHPNTITTINNLATLYEHQNRYDKAESLYGEALIALQKIYPSDHPNIKIVQNNLDILRNKKK